MSVNQHLLHNWFYGNYGVRIAAALVTAFLFGSLPMGPLVGWLFAGLDARSVGWARRAIGPLNAFKAFVPVAIVAHGGGFEIGVGAAFAAYLGHRFSPWLRFWGGRGLAVLGGCAAGLGWAFAAGRLLH